MTQLIAPIDPKSIPFKTLSTGARMPIVGLGTFGSDRFSKAQIADAVVEAARIGYRHFDCASVYSNEAEIGVSFEKIQAQGIRREELWITSKLWNDKHAEKDVIPSCEKTLRDLRLDYLDLYLIHWPFPNFHPPGCDVSSRSKDARPYIHENYMKTWQQLEKLVDRGLVKNIGTSNMTVVKMKLLLRDARIRPVCNEMELHPHFQQPELFDYLVSERIQPIGFCPIGSPNRPERDKTPEDTSPASDPVILEIAAARGVHPAIICIKWAFQRGQVPIPFSVKPEQMRSTLEATISEPLTQDEMKRIAALDRRCRLIKGQVFLWKDNQTWEDLWDENGVIAS